MSGFEVIALDTPYELVYYLLFESFFLFQYWYLLKMKRHVAPLDPNLVRLEQLAGEASIEPYMNEILQYLQTLEGSSNSALNPVMIDNQPEITWSMRPYIIDFLVEMHLFFRLSQETLHLACYIADKYCTKRIVYKRHYQLLVAASLWIAAKFHSKKTRIPTLKELCLLCHQNYDPQMILQMERHILVTLNWSIGNSVSAYDIVQCIVSTSASNTVPQVPELVGLANFLCDLSLYQRNFMSHSSPTKAITALLLASRILNLNNFPNFLSQQVAYCSDIDDLSFHIAGDKITEDVSLTLCKQNVDDIRDCLHLFMKEIFKVPNEKSKEAISATLIRKYKHLPIETWLATYKSENSQAYAQLSSLNDSLHFTRMNPYSTSTNSYLKDSIASRLDEFAGFKNVFKNSVEFELFPEMNGSFSELPFTPLSSFSSIDVDSPMRWEISTPVSSRSSSTLLTSHVRKASLTPGSSKLQATCPATPSSTGSIFSSRPRLSASSSASSFSLASSSSMANAKFHKMASRRSSRGSILNIRRSMSAQDNVPSIYE